MEIKKWKQFSDEVDCHNEIEWAEHREREEKHRKKEDEDNKRFYEKQLGRHEQMEKMLGMSLPTPLYRPIFSYSLFIGVAKTEVNFWEWQAGKLKLKTTPPTNHPIE